jgi:hypothetical protein
MVATIPPVMLEKPTESMPLRYGLFAAAQGPLDLPVHARNGGLRYVTALCAEGFNYEVECIATLNSKSSFFSAGTTTVTGVPFVVVATVKCGSVGYTPEEQRAWVIERMRGVEQAVVEETFSTGAVAQSPSLTAASGIITVAGAGDTITDVVGELERARYCGFGANATQYGPRAILHVAIPVLERMRQEHLVEWDGTRWRTAMGTVVSAGCYANNDPAGAAPVDGVFWLYITGQTVVWRTSDTDMEIMPIEGALQRSTNQVLMMAEREYVVTYECGGFAKSVILWT